MKKNEVLEFFGNASKAAKALGISIAAISQWGEEVPELRAFQIEKITKGKLKAKKFSKAG